MGANAHDPLSSTHVPVKPAVRTRSGTPTGSPRTTRNGAPVCPGGTAECHAAQWLGKRAWAGLSEHSPSGGELKLESSEPHHPWAHPARAGDRVGDLHRRHAVCVQPI